MEKPTLTAKLVSAALLVGALLFSPWPAPPPALALPPRPEPPPTAEPVQGGAIELRVQSAQAVEWAAVVTLVQWQDGLGGWHDVDGWRGTLDQLFADGGRKTWFVSKDLFGKQPFRWVIYQDEGAGAQPKTLGTSDPFTMPGHNGEVVRVIVDIKP